MRSIQYRVGHIAYSYSKGQLGPECAVGKIWAVENGTLGGNNLDSSHKFKYQTGTVVPVV
jgi:hypothetical protein